MIRELAISISMKGYTKTEIKREIESLKARLKYNEIGLKRARGARRNSYLEEKETLEDELKQFEAALKGTK
jgi:hypothetical protein